MLPDALKDDTPARAVNHDILRQRYQGFRLLPGARYSILGSLFRLLMKFRRTCAALCISERDGFATVRCTDVRADAQKN